MRLSLQGDDGTAVTASEQPTMQLVEEEAARLQKKGRQKLNAEQRAAVAAVVCGAGRTAPFALFGPPGGTLLLQPVLMHTAVTCAHAQLAGWGRGACLVVSWHLMERYHLDMMQLTVVYGGCTSCITAHDVFGPFF